MGKPPRCSMERTWGANSSNCLPGPFAAQDNEIFGVCFSYWHMNNLRMVCGCVTVPFHWDHWRIQWILKMTAHIQDSPSSCLSRAAQQPHSLSPGLPDTTMSQQSHWEGGAGQPPPHWPPHICRAADADGSLKAEILISAQWRVHWGQVIMHRRAHQAFMPN